MKEILEIRLALQKAFIGNISPQMRGITFDYDEKTEKFSIQIFFYQKQSEEDEELISIALTEFEAMCSFISAIKEDYIVSDISFSEMKELKNVIYWRNEKPVF